MCWEVKPMINLDDFNADELRLMISNESIPEEWVPYARYAILAAEAYNNGAQESARYYVEQCDKIYSQLPESLRW